MPQDPRAGTRAAGAERALPGGSGVARPESAIVEFAQASPTEREILHDELAEARRQKSWATTWLMVVGFGPAAIIAVLLALVVEGSRELAIAFALLGAAVLGLRAYRAERRIQELERELEDPMDGS
ncbi:MAG: hypothetical protein OEN56_07155 [Gemmatimonadota bacterium]|nr:hypothetical protein [Gemmatimonadota bacterium]